MPFLYLNLESKTPETKKKIRHQYGASFMVVKEMAFYGGQLYKHKLIPFYLKNNVLNDIPLKSWIFKIRLTLGDGGIDDVIVYLVVLTSENSEEIDDYK